VTACLLSSNASLKINEIVRNMTNEPLPAAQLDAWICMTGASLALSDSVEVLWEDFDARSTCMPVLWAHVPNERQQRRSQRRHPPRWHERNNSTAMSRHSESEAEVVTVLGKHMGTLLDTHATAGASRNIDAQEEAVRIQSLEALHLDATWWTGFAPSLGKWVRTLACKYAAIISIDAVSTGTVTCTLGLGQAMKCCAIWRWHAARIRQLRASIVSMRWPNPCFG
jgi:hypothetical protein